MKKAVKGIIGLSAVLAVLGGGYAALMLTQPESDEDMNNSSGTESSETEQQAVILIHDDKVTGTDPDTGADLKGVVKTVSVKNRTDKLQVVQRDEKTENGVVTYTLDGYQDIEMKTSVIGTLANNANGLTSEAVIEKNCTDLAKFGLASPEITVDVEYETGTEYTLFIGNEAPSGDVTYVMLDGIDTVFTVKNSTIANYSKSLIEFVETKVLASPDEQPVVESLRIEREDIDYDIYLEYVQNDDTYSGGTSASHMMKEPTQAYLSVENSTDITTGMFGLSADGIYSVHCSDSDIAEAGLKEPFCTVTMECDDGNDYKLLLSEPFTDDENKKCCYAMMDGGNVIFIVSTENAKWAVVQPVDIASTIFIASYVWNITDLSLTAGADEYKFVTERIDPDAEIESLKSDDFRTTLNGRDFSSERYRQFYSFLISGNAENFALDEKIPAGEPMAVLEYTDSYDNSTNLFEFYDYSSMTALIAVNGESKFFISKSYVETLIENAKKLNSEEDFIKTWK